MGGRGSRPRETRWIWGRKKEIKGKEKEAIFSKINLAYSQFCLGPSLVQIQTLFLLCTYVLKDEESGKFKF